MEACETRRPATVCGIRPVPGRAGQIDADCSVPCSSAVRLTLAETGMQFEHRDVAPESEGGE
jgi:hypothetical protein